MFAQDVPQPQATKPQVPATPVPAPLLSDLPAPASAVDPNLPRGVNYKTFELQIYNQVGLVFKGNVIGVSSANDQGPFDILPGHTNFISLIKQPVVVYPQEGPPRKYEVGLGVIRCLYNKVEIFTGLLVNKESEAVAKELIPQKE